MADSVNGSSLLASPGIVRLLRGKENAAAGKVVFSGGAGGYSNSVEVDPLRRRFRYAGDRANLSRRGQ
jgi:murein DD-endopeptidase MepM/ murein hydrolase activator NlpD